MRGTGVQRGKWGPGSTSFLSGGTGWEHSGGCLLLGCRWGSGGVCCHGSRAGPLDSLVWCGWPCRRLALYAGVTVIAGWVTVNASTYKRGEDRHSWGLIMAWPGQGCHSHTLWSCGFFCTPLWGLLICLTDGERAVSDGDASPWDACTGEFLWRVCCVRVCMCANYRPLVTCQTLHRRHDASFDIVFF